MRIWNFRRCVRILVIELCDFVINGYLTTSEGTGAFVGKSSFLHRTALLVRRMRKIAKSGC